jgi:hypothetical protein
MSNNTLKDDFNKIKSLSDDLNNIRNSGGVAEIVENLPEYMSRFDETEKSYNNIMDNLSKMKGQIQQKQQS